MSNSKYSLYGALFLMLSCATHLIITVRAIPAEPKAALNKTVALPMTKRFNFTGSLGKILQYDQERARALHARGMALATGSAPPPIPDVGNVSIQNQLATYLATVSDETLTTSPGMSS